MKRFFLLTASILAFLTMAATNGRAVVQASDSHAAFFANIKQLCGRSFEGATEFPQNPDHPLVGKKLVITVETCGEKEIRIPFQVGEDRSRTWVLRLDEKGLLLKHDHRHADGTPDKVTMYGGWAAAEGTPHRQRFPADSETKELIPEAATNVWMIEIDEKRQELVYYLERHKEPRYRAVFKLIPIKK
jgi:hypothetical protein